MKTASFEQFRTGGRIEIDLQRAIKACKAQGIEKLTFETGVYELEPLYCAQHSLNISNHGFNGPKRIAVLIEGMENFEIDFGGSTFVSKGIMTPIAVLNSKNIRLRGLKMKNTDVPLVPLRVTGYGEDYIETLHLGGGLHRLMWHQGLIFGTYPGKHFAHACGNVEFDGETGELAVGTWFDTLGITGAALRFEKTDESHVRIYGAKRRPPIGNVLVFIGTSRVGAGIFCEKSRDVTFEDFDIYSCYGMGLIAQVCENMTLRCFNTVREEGAYQTAAADATHFVNCSGVVLVEDCSFVGQMDDAINIHGMYTRVVDKGEKWLMVRQMHYQATGIPIYEPGDVIQALPTDTLLPYTQKTVREVEWINDECVLIYTQEDVAEIAVGDDIESVTRNADLIFRRNVVRDNFSRGMLIGTPGKVLIADCDFHTSGPSIKFESDGGSWFEAGGTKDVTIENNRFVRCRYIGLGEGVIVFQPRERTEEGRYFHGTIRVKHNLFDGGAQKLAVVNNAAAFEFTGNTIVNNEGACVETAHVGKKMLQSV